MMLMSEFCVYANFHSPNTNVRRENFNKFSKAVGGAINDKDLCVENVACGCLISKNLKLLLVPPKSLFIPLCLTLGIHGVVEVVTTPRI